MQLLGKSFGNERVMKAMLSLGGAKFGELGERLEQFHVKNSRAAKTASAPSAEGGPG